MVVVSAPRWRPGWTLLMVGLVALGAAGGAIGAGEEGTDSDAEAGGVDPLTSVGTTTSSFRWETTYRGDLALRIVMDFDGLELCTFHFIAEGLVAGAQVLSYTAFDEPGKGWTAFTPDYIAGAHVSGVSIRSNDPPGNAWASWATHGFSAFGSEAFLFAGSDLYAWDSQFTDGKSLILDLSCTGPFTITQIEGGKSVAGFIPAYTVGGAGIHTPLADLNAADFHVHAFAEPHVAFRFDAEASAGGGLLMLSGPGDADGTWTMGGNTEVHLDGGDGRYQATLTRAAIAGRAVGLLVGLQDVASFDAALTL